MTDPPGQEDLIATAQAAEQPAGPPAGWYPDQEMPDTQRYWTGAEWSEHRAPLADSTARAAWPGELIVCLGASVALLIGVLGTWLSAGFISASGLDTEDGKLVGAIGVLALCVSVAAVRNHDAKWGWLFVAGAIAAAVAIADLVDVYQSTANLFGQQTRIGSAGWGLWLDAGAGVVLAIGALALRSHIHRERRGAAPQS